MQQEEADSHDQPRAALAGHREHAAEHIRVGEVVERLKFGVRCLQALHTPLQLSHEELQVVQFQVVHFEIMGVVEIFFRCLLLGRGGPSLPRVDPTRVASLAWEREHQRPRRVAS